MTSFTRQNRIASSHQPADNNQQSVRQKLAFFLFPSRSLPVPLPLRKMLLALHLRVVQAVAANQRQPVATAWPNRAHRDDLGFLWRPDPRWYRCIAVYTYAAGSWHAGSAYPSTPSTLHISRGLSRKSITMGHRSETNLPPSLVW